MAVTKRTRYEVLRRDNHTCRYCGVSVPEAKLAVDHVTPLALGGSDDPSNLVAACIDCNAGKASTSPDAALVEDVKALDLKWAGAIKRVAAARGRQRRKEDRYACAFYDYWILWKNGRGEVVPMPNNWEIGIRRFYELGLTIDDLMRCVDIAMGNLKVSRDETYRYFAGCAWRTVTEIQDAAKALLEAEAIDGS